MSAYKKIYYFILGKYEMLSVTLSFEVSGHVEILKIHFILFPGIPDLSGQLFYCRHGHGREFREGFK